jgi:hypothetical protein
MITHFEWIAVSERLPNNSRKVLITDGKQISTANYFAKTYNPSKNEHGGPIWANQHDIMTGWVDEPTHWAELDSLLPTIPHKEGQNDTNA